MLNEAIAAKAAGLQVLLSSRPGNISIESQYSSLEKSELGSPFEIITNFNQL
jgi:hypothetical protein